MEITVSKGFIDHRTAKSKIYKQGGRSERAFLMNIDSEIWEYYYISRSLAKPHKDWRVDYVDLDTTVDVKFINRRWNITAEGLYNILQQRKILDVYWFMQWNKRPSRPLKEGDKVVISMIGCLTYEQAVDNIQKTNYGEFYVDVRNLL